ncbi:Flp pilus assembly complex ATPase component TadA [Aeoliella sp. ICT_H6.2]|uniref:Flp pilus assembly complex ATPase component TadA n=1 Tax=Aeoliella straminimaris TaxID=2954799 RepID=A0A9X2JKP4_9BACT|nr:ATPase, T2SS/T4P/T4SS family [Aeoliella straminimaris]MCO6047024.1 Flp pilus assembly complex ATPase component TadA [Aeoliella straminimaris]
MDLGQYLVKQGLISQEQWAEAKQLATSQHMKPQDALVQLGYSSSEQIMQALAARDGFEYYDLRDVAIPPAVVELVPESVARENAVIPLSEEDGVLRVLVSDPQDFDTIDKLQFILNRKIEIALATRESILEAINRNYGQIGDESADSMLQEFTDTAIDFTETEEGDGADEDDLVDEASAPIVRLVQLMIGEAVQLRASDIHVEPFEDRVRIRYRIDGVLVERDSPPRRLLGALLSRIKILARMDIAERRRTQDGRIKITAGGKELDLRVSMLPTNHGQSCVMRLLDKDNIKVGVRQLGLSDRDFKVFRNLIRRPNGILLVTGPTGSGKTTTLYAAMNELNRPDRKIITAEDPVEYYLPGINQVEVRHSIGLDFALIIRAMLRQAPNVILVGEMRDYETASMGIQASLTGHLVFSTLHTNDAPGAVTRMVDMGVPSYLVAGSVIGILAQRLVRVICSKCKQPYTPRDTELEAAGIPPEMAAEANFMKGRGCSHCGNSGYRGRLGVFELMTMNSRIRELTFQGASTQEIRKEAVSLGMTTLYDDAILKVCKGITTLDEVFRVAKKVT